MAHIMANSQQDDTGRDFMSTKSDGTAFGCYNNGDYIHVWAVRGNRVYRSVVKSAPGFTSVNFVSMRELAPTPGGLTFLLGSECSKFVMPEATDVLLPQRDNIQHVTSYVYHVENGVSDTTYALSNVITFYDLARTEGKKIEATHLEYSADGNRYSTVSLAEWLRHKPITAKYIRLYRGQEVLPVTSMIFFGLS